MKMHHGRELLRAAPLAITGLIALMTGGAHAANVVFYPGTDFSKTPATISFGGGAATYTFSYLNDGYTADAVSTGGTGLINSFAFLGPERPIAFELGAPIGDTGYPDFTTFTSPIGIDYSIAEDSIGLEFTLADGIHYGYVTTLGPEILQYGYNDTVGASIETGAGVPEPNTWAMMIVGLGMLGAAYRFKRNLLAPTMIT